MTARPGPPRRAGLAAAGLALLLTAAGCGGGGTGDGPGREPAPGRALTTGEDGDGAARAEAAEFEEMARRLEAAGALFIGGSRVAELRAAVAAAPPGRPAIEARGELAMELLRLGDSGAALEELRRVESLEEASWQAADAPTGPGGRDERARRRRQILQKLMLAALLFGEDSNCVAHHAGESCILPLRGDGVHADRRGAEAAVDYALQLLAADPDDLKALWFLNLAAQQAARWPEGVPERFRILPSRLTSAADLAAFVNVAPALGLARVDLAGGSVMEDLDGDGWLDLLTSTMDPRGPLSLMLSNGDGTFRDATAGSGLERQWGGLSLTAADYDNDGDVDILVLRGGWLQQQGRLRNSLLRNDGGGRFTDVTRQAGLAEPALPTQTGAWGDYDGDGDLDLYIGNEGYQEGDDRVAFPDNLFRNNGDGTFSDVAASAGVRNDRYAKGAAWGDYDGDGDPDLYVSNIGANRLYRNDGEGRFTDVAPALGVAEPAGRSFATWWFDFDQDGDLDLFVAAYAAAIEDVVADILGRRPDRPETWPRLYRNDGGAFTDVTRAAGLDHPSLPMGANFGDINGDGYPDIYLGTGTPAWESILPNLLYLNRGDGTFIDATYAARVGHLQKGHGIAFGDLDRDGDEDLMLQAGGFFPGDAFADALFANPAPPARWLAVRLQGVAASRLGLGARLRLRLRGPAGERSLYRWVTTGGSFGVSPHEQLFGLGPGPVQLEALEIRWPGGGPDQVITGLPLDAVVTIRQGDESLETARPPAADLAASVRPAR